MTQSTNNLIERYFRLSPSKIYCLGKRSIVYSKPLFIIPIINIKSVERVNIANKVSSHYNNKNGNNLRTNNEHAKYYFKIILDVPLESKKSSNAVTN